MLLFGLTVDDIKSGISKLRNRVIGRVFKELGFIEQWGSGIQRVLKICHEMGLPVPVFEEVGCRFRATLFINKINEAVTDAVDQKILHCLNKEGLTTKEISGHILLSSRATRTRLKSLIEKKLVVEIGSGPNDPHKKYFLS